MSKQIKLTQGKYALVDDKDYNWLNQYKWCAVKLRKTYYAMRQEKGKSVYMHRKILGLKPGDGKHTDHINYNGLNNCRCNLRIVTIQQNQFNKPNVKGYSWDKNINKWKTLIGFNNKSIYLGHFDNEKDAHKAYLKAKQKYHKMKGE